MGIDAEWSTEEYQELLKTAGGELAERTRGLEPDYLIIHKRALG
jgi:hypothetical protein